MSGKTPEEVAFDLVAKLKGMGVWGEKNMPDILDMYAECLDATQGSRKYIPGRAILEPEAKAKLDAIHKQAAQRNAQQVQSQPVQAQAVQAPVQQTRTPQPPQTQAPQAQPVQAQQQILQQAYKQG